MPKLKYLASLATEIDKFVFETESEAQKLIEEELGSLRRQRSMVMDQARKTLESHKADITNLAVELDTAAGALGDNSIPTKKVVEGDTSRS